MHDKNPSNLPPGYTLDLAGDPCVIVLRRAGDGVVARFTRNVDPRGDKANRPRRSHGERS